MKPFYVTYDYNYPIYLYLEDPDISVEINNELHVNYATCVGYCTEIHCDNCPIQTECAVSSDLLRLLPKKDFIELYI